MDIVCRVAARKQRRRRRARDPWWVEASTDELLDLRFCDLGLSIEGSALGARIERLYAELERAGLRFKPYVWLSHEWFTPEGASGFAVPFYLAHPRLVRLEHSQMFEAEASTAKQCMRFLRHETAHALDFAYRLHHRADWRRTFGRYGQPYRDDYQPNPTSRRFVQNLGNWYAQSHPVEDWAETFSVWLAPNSRWRTTYAGWPALQKLEAVDTLMREIGPKRPLVTTRTRDDSLPKLRTTLREHYAQKKDAYGHGQPWRHDRQLRLIFSPPGERGPTAGAERAAKFVLEHRNELRTKVSALTGAHRFVVDESIDSLVRRCRELDLRVLRARSQARLGAAVLLTMLTMSLANGGRPRFSR
jgi:hypothetical protein